MFVIQGDLLRLAPGTKADYERAPTLVVRVRSTDDGAPFHRSVTTTFTIDVLDRNETPTDIFPAVADCRPDVGVGLVRVASRSISPPWGSIRFRLALRTYAPPGVRVVSQTKSRKIPTRKILPLFFVSRHAPRLSFCWKGASRARTSG